LFREMVTLPAACSRGQVGAVVMDCTLPAAPDTTGVLSFEYPGTMERMTPPPRCYSVPELAEVLRVTPAFVRERTNRRQWPHLRLGARTVTFTHTHLQEIIRLSERLPAERVSPSATRRRRQAVMGALKHL
jgi:hypothetical protein